MGFASVIGQAFLIIIFILLFAQLYIMQHNQNKIQAELFSYQTNILATQKNTQLALVRADYNDTRNTTNIQIRNSGSTLIQINNSDIYIDDVKFSREYTARKFFACFEYADHRCGEIGFGDNDNQEDTDLQLLFHFNNDSQWESDVAPNIKNYAANSADLSHSNIITSSAGKFDKAIQFSAISQSYLSAANTPQNEFVNTSSYTWSYWINPSAYGNNTRTIMSKNSATSGYSILIDTSANIQIQSASDASLFTCSQSIQLNTWSHVAIVYEADNTIKCFIDGNLVNSVATNSVFVTDTASQFNIGRNVSTQNDYFQGSIDEFALYNSAKSSTQVKALYRKGLFASGVRNFDPGEVLEIDVYYNLSQGTHIVSYATQEGVGVSATMVIS
jgi:archaellum component FlaF (FlaF/FlaG flagellin family)